MKLTSDVQDIPWKKVSIIGVVLLVIVGAALATLKNKTHPQHPLTPEANKAAVDSYLKERAETSAFIPEMEAVKEKNPWNVLEPRYEAPLDYKTVYRNIGEDLIIADQLINGTIERDQILGMKMITDLCDVAIDVAVDPWLAARISDGYLIPNLDKIEEKPKNGPGREVFMIRARKIYKEAEETDRLIALGKSYLAQNPPVDRADRIRWSLGRELEQKGETKEALKYFREISHSSLTNEANKRITSLEQKVKTLSK